MPRNLRGRRSGWQRVLLGIDVGLGVGLGGCGAMVAQDPSSALTPINAVALEGDSRVMLQGADVVA